MADCRNCLGWGSLYLDTLDGETARINKQGEAIGWDELRQAGTHIDWLECSSCGGSGLDEERLQKRIV